MRRRTFWIIVGLPLALINVAASTAAALPVVRELSHAHLQGWIGTNAVLHLPSWFNEGLAVMVSGGGGAELVSEEEARTAIQRGEQIAIDDAGSLQSLSGIRFDRVPAKTAPSWYPVVLAYRQAGLFVNYLRESDGSAFDGMMKAILDGRPFVQAVDASYHQDVRSLWQKFVQTVAERKRLPATHAVFAVFNPSRDSTASRIMNFWILPVTVIGNSSTNST
jgi:hypothetical protein